MINKIQLVPELVTLESNVNSISPTYYAQKLENFFPLEKNSLLNFKYYVSDNDFEKKEVELQFGNLTYFKKEWLFLSKKYFFNFRAKIDEKENSFCLNKNYHFLPISIGGLLTAGSLFQDYINYVLENNNAFCISASATKINGKTFLFVGNGRNFKTTFLSMCLDMGGSYIAEETAVIKDQYIYGTIPVFPKYDKRDSHESLFNKNLKKLMISKSIYDYVVFLMYSNKNELCEIKRESANKLAEEYYKNGKYFFYDFFKLRDLLLNKTNKKVSNIFSNSKAKYFKLRFNDVKNISVLLSNYKVINL